MSSNKVICPFCSRPVDIKKFGYGWVGTCCHKIIYNSDRSPWTKMQGNVEAAKNIVSKRSGIENLGKHSTGTNSSEIGRVATAHY